MQFLFDGKCKWIYIVKISGVGGAEGKCSTGFLFITTSRNRLLF